MRSFQGEIVDPRANTEVKKKGGAYETDNWCVFGAIGLDADCPIGRYKASVRYRDRGGYLLLSDSGRGVVLQGGYLLFRLDSRLSVQRIGGRVMEILVTSKRKSRQVVYVQMRQYIRNKKGILTMTKTKTITVHDATIPQVEAALRKGGQ